MKLVRYYMQTKPYFLKKEQTTFAIWFAPEMLI